MKRLGSSDSLGGGLGSGLMSVCSSKEKSLGEISNHNNNSSVYSHGFQSMLEGLDEEDGMEEVGHVSEKKRRLSGDQVKALEKNFEVENKLEPERKVKLAQELGLQPRQVAVWFQNRRARWKTKQLERDYGVLKANYDSLKLDFESLRQEKESLQIELKNLKAKLHQDEEEENAPSEEIYIKKEIPVSESSIPMESEIPGTNPTMNNNGVPISMFTDFKDGSSDSDSSAILNDDNNNNNTSPNGAISSSGILNTHLTSHMSPASSSPLGFNCSSSSSPPSINCFPFSDSRSICANSQKQQQQQQPFSNQPFVRMEEHNFFGVEETCNFFSDDQAPTLQWYYPNDQWS